MLSNISKIILGIFSLFLVIILFAPFPLHPKNNIGFIFLFIEGILALITSIFLANDVKKLNNSSRSKFLSILLINTTLYAVALLFYGLGNIGVGDMGLPGAFIMWLYLILLVSSIPIGIILVVRNKTNTSQGNPNKILSLILFLVLIVLFYTPLVFGMARLFQSPTLCSMQIEIKDNSFIFNKGGQDLCVLRVAIKTLRADYCKLLQNSVKGDSIGDPNFCIFIIARDSKDLDICNQIDNEKGKADCIDQVNFAKAHF